MNFKMIDEHGRQLEMGRNLVTLRAEFGGQARESFQRIASAEKLSLLDSGKNIALSVGAKKSSPVIASSQTDAGSASSSRLLSAAAGVAVVTPAFQLQQEKLTGWTFDSLPELLEVQQGKQTLIGYPALVDKITHCYIEVFDDPDEAARVHRIGLRRLFGLQIREQVKFLEKNIPGLQQMGMQFMALGSQEELREQIVQVALESAFLQHPLPTNSGEFNQRRDAGKARLNLLANEIARLAAQILSEYHGLPKKLQALKVHSQAASDMQGQLQLLINKNFIADNDFTQLSHFPRYLKAITVRMDKLRADPARDAKLLLEWNSVAQPWQRVPRKSGPDADPKLQEFRWLLEELRVSLFAQELRTPMPVSAKRLQKVWESFQR
jgi:ATP-dependent helicase HrpA